MQINLTNVNEESKRKKKAGVSLMNTSCLLQLIREPAKVRNRPGRQVLGSAYRGFWDPVRKAQIC